MSLKFTLDRAGVRELLNSPEIAADVRRRANQIASTAGKGWQAESTRSAKGDRVAATVTAVTYEARRENNKNHTLMRSIDAGRT